MIGDRIMATQVARADKHNEDTRPCRTCRHARLPWLARWLGEWDRATCANPVVVENWHLNARLGFITPQLMDGGPIYPADPVTGEPERRVIPCALARMEHTDRTTWLKSEEPERRAPSCCGPNGRYWQRKGT